jgi:hypothetical protein
MAYKANKPEANDQISVSQADIKGNFTDIDTLVAVDHVGFNLTGAGMHKQVNLLRNGTPVLNVGGYGLYVDNAGFPGTLDTTNLQLIRVGHSTFPICGPAASSAVTNGFSYLPSGIILKWGTVTLGANPTPVTINLPNSIHNAQVSFSSALAPMGTTIAAVIANTGVGNNKIDIYTGGASGVNVCWFVIGN